MIDIDGLKDDMEDEELLNKLLGESFYFILLLSVYFLDYKDIFIFVRFKEVEKEVLNATSITVTTATSGTAAK